MFQAKLTVKTLQNYVTNLICTYITVAPYIWHTVYSSTHSIVDAKVE